MTQTDKRSLQAKNKQEAVPYTTMLMRVCSDLGEPIRYLFNAPVIVHSGFRCQEVNAAIEGSPTSEHMLGRAMDFHILGYRDEAGLRYCLEKILNSDIKFHQLLIEGGCLHISLPHDGEIAGEVAYWEDGQKQVIRPREA
jgi:hypothetical protein